MHAPPVAILRSEIEFFYGEGALDLCAYGSSTSALVCKSWIRH